MRSTRRVIVLNSSRKNRYVLFVVFERSLHPRHTKYQNRMKNQSPYENGVCVRYTLIRFAHRNWECIKHYYCAGEFNIIHPRRPQRWNQINSAISSLKVNVYLCIRFLWNGHFNSRCAQKYEEIGKKTHSRTFFTFILRWLYLTCHTHTHALDYFLSVFEGTVVCARLNFPFSSTV